MTYSLLLDYIESVQADENVFRNEIYTLTVMRTGIEALYNQVKEYEDRVPKDRSVTMVMGSPHHSDLELDLLVNLFHWFGISMVNYTRLVGYISGIHRSIYNRNDLSDATKYKLVKDHVDAYVDGIAELQSVNKWRNKVAAHFAITDPRKSSDTASILAYSVMSPVQFFSGHFNVGIGDMQIQHHGGGAELNQFFPQWSVVETFEAIQPRFWPQPLLSDSGS